MFFVYILYSESFHMFYVGQTNNLQQRLDRHNQGLENFTKKYRPWVFAGYVIKESRADAMALEKKLKNLSKDRLKKFIAKHCIKYG